METQNLQLQPGGSPSPLFVNLKDIFYSPPQGELCLVVRKCIDNKGGVQFNNVAGVSVNSFLKLVSFWLGATKIQLEEALYRHKDDPCIGSCIVLIQGKLYLIKYNRNIHSY